MAEPLLRYESSPKPAPLGNTETAGRRRVDNDGILADIRTLSGQCRKEFRLAIAGHTGNRDDLSCPHLQRDILQGDGEGAVGRLVEMVDAQLDVTGGGAPCRTNDLHIRANHLTGEARCGFLLRIGFVDDLAVAQDRWLVTERLHLLKPMGDIENGAA